jgi:L-serine/L-threonine ammonia-lyase
MSPLHVETPVWPSPWFTRRAGRAVLLKMEALQPSGSFKIRGIGALCRLAAERGRTRFVCPSGGNAGLAAAYACRGLSVSLTVLVPESTKEGTRRLLAEAGAQVEVAGADWQATHEVAKEHAVRFGAELIHPFDDRMIWEGHATLIEELVHQLGGPPAGIVVSVGGGGLLGGVLVGLERVGWAGVPVHAVETQGAACFAAACAAGEVRGAADDHQRGHQPGGPRGLPHGLRARAARRRPEPRRDGRRRGPGRARSPRCAPGAGGAGVRGRAGRRRPGAQ